LGSKIIADSILPKIIINDDRKVFLCSILCLREERPSDWPPIESRLFFLAQCASFQESLPCSEQKVCRQKKWSAGDVRKVLCGEVIAHTYDGFSRFFTNENLLRFMETLKMRVLLVFQVLSSFD
jgi:hypothetical protein